MSIASTTVNAMPGHYAQNTYSCRLSISCEGDLVGGLVDVVKIAKLDVTLN